jgi:hypothetical protein
MGNIMRFLIILALSLAVASCGSSVMREAGVGAGTLTGGVVSDTIDLNQLKAENKAVAFIHAVHNNSGCGTISLEFGQSKGIGGVYALKERYVIKSFYNATELPSQLELSAGEHHIVSVTCRNGARYSIVSAGSATSGFFMKETIYLRPIASFTLQAGEVVNVGSIQMSSLMVEGLNRGSAGIVITDLPAPMLQEIKTQRPNLAAVMQTRFMVKVGK